MSYQMDFIPPLQVGDVALRFRTAVRGDLFTPHRVILGTQAVLVVAVDGDRVTWTDGTRSRLGGEYKHTSPRRELIAVSALETLGSECAVNRNGCAPTQPAEARCASAA